MGTVAARDCLRVLELSEQAAAGLTLAAVQGVRLRQMQDDGTRVTAGVAAFMDSVTQQSPFVDEDRPLEHELRTLCALIRQAKWDLYRHE